VSAMDRIEAERTVADLEREGDQHWRLSGGDRQTHVDAVLREALIEALAEGSRDTEAYEDLKSEISEAQRRIEDLNVDHSIGDEFDTSISSAAGCDPAKFADRAFDLLTALARRVDAQRGEIERLKDESKPVEPTVRIVRPGVRSARPRLGSTTLALPFLQTVAANETKIEIRDTLPSKIGSVEVEKKSKRTRKPKAAA
jgi:hypothetical protein